MTDSPPEYPPVCKYLDAPAAKLPDEVYNHLLDVTNDTWRDAEAGRHGQITPSDAVILMLMQHICYLESIIETTGN